MVEWILSLMLMLVPQSSWLSSYQATAEAIDKVAHEQPIYEGSDGVVRTAIELVAVTFYESRFNPEAKFEDDGGDSLGLGQINVSNLPFLGMKRNDLLNQLANLRATVKLLIDSHEVCRRWPLWYQLSEYASGRGRCDVPAALRDSKRKMQLAQDLLSAHPPFWLDSTQ